MFNLDFFVDESSFRKSQTIQKCLKLTKHPNFKKKIWTLVCPWSQRGKCDMGDWLFAYQTLRGPSPPSFP